MFATYKIKMDQASTVLHYMCQLYEVVKLEVFPFFTNRCLFSALMDSKAILDLDWPLKPAITNFMIVFSIEIQWWWLSALTGSTHAVGSLEVLHGLPSWVPPERAWRQVHNNILVLERSVAIGAWGCWRADQTISSMLSAVCFILSDYDACSLSGFLKVSIQS